MNTVKFEALAVAILLACAGPALRVAAGESAAEQEKKLLAVLESGAPKSEKAITCKRLVLCGSKACVPALAALLTDPELASWARIPLEAIPDPAVDEALRNSVARYQGKLLIGVMNSIGVRRDPKAIDVLAGKLKDPDVEVVAAAAAALGKIGGPAAAKILTDFLLACPPPARPDAAEALLLCADRMTAEGKNDEAVRIYDFVRKADLPKQRIVEAIRGAILARKAAGIPLLIEQLKSEDKAFFGIGLRVARELPGPEATEALVAELGKLKPECQPLLLMALADRNDPKALPAILAAIEKGPKNATLAGLNVMERIGNASCIPVLSGVALGDDKEIALAAKAALTKLPAADVDADIVARLAQTSGKTRQLLIEVMGYRRSESAASALVPFLSDADAGVRSEAAKSIAALGNERQLPEVVKVRQKTQDAGERSALERALTGCAARGRRQEHCSHPLTTPESAAGGCRLRGSRHAHELVKKIIMRPNFGPGGAFLAGKMPTVAHGPVRSRASDFSAPQPPGLRPNRAIRTSVRFNPPNQTWAGFTAGPIFFRQPRPRTMGRSHHGPFTWLMHRHQRMESITARRRSPHQVRCRGRRCRRSAPERPQNRCPRPERP